MYEINLIHYTKLTDRLTVIEKIFKDSIFTLKIISQCDKENLSKEELKLFDTDYLSKGEISCFMKHVKVYEKLVENHEEKFAIVIEDDILIKKNFDKKLLTLLNKLPDDFDFVFFGASKLDLHIPLYKRRPLKRMYKKINTPTDWGGNGMSKTTDSYVVSKKGAKSILDRIAKSKILDDALDFWLNQSARELNLKGYWYEPTITIYNDKFESNLASQYNNVKSKN
jgi:GR25 family glycosyltransferase involved in LPS biosynthesis